MIAQQSGSKVWVYFRCEKSQNFCYSCGMLVHVLHKCASECKFADDGSFPYGPGLRASPLQKRYVSGSYRMRTASGQSESQPSKQCDSVHRKILFPGEEAKTSACKTCGSKDFHLGDQCYNNGQHEPGRVQLWDGNSEQVVNLIPGDPHVETQQPSNVDRVTGTLHEMQKLEPGEEI